jgi:hypothetical protein
MHCEVQSVPVLRIRDIMIFIRIRGSLLVLPEPAIFVIDLKEGNKNKLFYKFFLLINGTL